MEHSPQDPHGLEMAVYTSFMVSLAEFSHVASIIVILSCTVVMLTFILRLVGQDLLNGFPGGVTRVPPPGHAPRVKMDLTRLDITTKIIECHGNLLKIRAMTNVSGETLQYRVYWGVAVSAFHHVLRSPWGWFQEAFQRGNLFGSEGCSVLGPMERIDCENQVDISLECPTLNLGPAPRNQYPLVLVAIPKRHLNSNSDSPEGEFVINVIHVKDELCHFPTHILGSYLKHRNSKATHLIPLYPGDEDNDNQCVVCISRPATRVTLPCRHASVCGQCFVKLPQSKCPMCRTFIQSYFLLKPEEEEEDQCQDQEPDDPPITWRQRLAEFEHRFAMAAGLQEND